MNEAFLGGRVRLEMKAKREIEFGRKNEGNEGVKNVRIWKKIDTLKAKRHGWSHKRILSWASSSRMNWNRSSHSNPF